MGNIVILDEKDIDLLWNTIQEKQVIFHPRIAYNGKIDFKQSSNNCFASCNFWIQKTKNHSFCLLIEIF